MNGFLNLYKPKGVSSAYVLNAVKRAIKGETVGHMGTLDPLASGVLPVAIGKSTRLFDYLLDKKKEYVATIAFGYSTDTYDLEGKIVERRDVLPNEETVKEACMKLVGEIMQIPPMVSAVKINGKKLYQLAREGKTVERQPRKITIYDMEITDTALPKVQLRVTCSGGTYIRTLINDIGEKLGVGAYMSALERQAVGSFDLAHALPLEKIKEMLEADDYSCLLPLEYGLDHLPVLNLADEKFFEDVLHGRPLVWKEQIPSGTYKLFYQNRIVAVAAADGKTLKMRKVLISEND